MEETLKYDLFPIITDELKFLYRLKSINEVYNYISLRFAIHKGTKKYSQRELVEFIVEELNLQNSVNQYVIYLDETYYFKDWMDEFADNFEFRASMEGPIDFESKYSKVLAKGATKARKYKELKEYPEYIKYFRLEALNNEYQADPQFSEGITGFILPPNLSPFKRTLEESLKATMDASKFLGTNTTSHITEEDLENYLVKNLSVIEEELTLVGRQVRVSGGIIDILAKDKEGTLCVIELKIKEDKSLLWQTLHYPEAIKKKYKVNKVRMITIAPKYRTHMIDTLKKNGNVESYSYNIKVESKDIKEFKIRKII